MLHVEQQSVLSEGGHARFLREKKSKMASQVISRHSHDALAAVEDDAQEDQREHDHAHAGDAGDCESAEGDGVFHGAQPFEQDGDDRAAEDAAREGAEAPARRS